MSRRFSAQRRCTRPSGWWSEREAFHFAFIATFSCCVFFESNVLARSLPIHRLGGAAESEQPSLEISSFPKVVRLKTGEVLYEKSYLSPRPPPKISLRHDHDWTRGNDELGSTVEQQPVGKLVQQPFGEVQRVKLSKPTQSKPKPICDRSEKPEDTEHVFVDKGKTSRSHEINEKRLLKELGSSDRSGKPERLSEDIRVKHAHDGTGQPVEPSSSSTHIVKEQLFLKKIVTLHLFTRTTSSTVQSTRRTLTSTFQECQIQQ